MSKAIIIGIILLALSLGANAQEEDVAIHEELRGLLTGIQQAVNEERWGDIGQYFHRDMTVTTINQEVLTSPDDIEPYFDGWFGEGGYLESVEMSFEADALTRLNADKTLGIVFGSGKEDYMLAKGRFFSMDTRWTATVIKDDDGAWRILSIHIGTDFLDNPVLGSMERATRYTAAVSAIAGLLIGLLLSWLWRRRSAA